MAMTELVSSAVSPEQRGKQQKIPRAWLRGRLTVTAFFQEQNANVNCELFVKKPEKARNDHRNS